VGSILVVCVSKTGGILSCVLIVQTAVLLLRIDDIVSGLKKKGREAAPTKREEEEMQQPAGEAND
jgi:hypothetical protein